MWFIGQHHLHRYHPTHSDDQHGQEVISSPSYAKQTSNPTVPPKFPALAKDEVVTSERLVKVRPRFSFLNGDTLSHGPSQRFLAVHDHDFDQGQTTSAGLIAAYQHQSQVKTVPATTRTTSPRSTLIHTTSKHCHDEGQLRCNITKPGLPKSLSRDPVNGAPVNPRRQYPNNDSRHPQNATSGEISSRAAENRSSAESPRSHPRAIKRSPNYAAELDEGLQIRDAEKRYKSSTWRMYNRIVSHREKNPLRSNYSELSRLTTEGFSKDWKQTTQHCYEEQDNFIPNSTDFQFRGMVVPPESITCISPAPPQQASDLDETAIFEMEI